MSTRTKLTAPLIGWTFFVWTSRIRNIWTDESLTTNGQVIRTVIACVFLAFAVAVTRMLWLRRGAELRPADRTLLTVFVAWSIGFWLIRGIGIIVDDHSASFTTIHTLLMVFSIALALLASKAIPGPRPPEPGPVVPAQRENLR